MSSNEWIHKYFQPDCLRNVDLTGEGSPTGFIIIHTNIFNTMDNTSFDIRGACDFKIDGEKGEPVMLFSTGTGKIVKPGERYIYYFPRPGGLKPGTHKIHLDTPSFSASVDRLLIEGAGSISFDNLLFGYNPHDKPIKKNDTLNPVRKEMARQSISPSQGKYDYNAAIQRIRLNKETRQVRNEALIQRVIWQLDSGDLEGALEGLNAALLIEPDFAKAWVCLGDTLRRKEDVPGAIAACNKALSLDREDPDGWNILGASLLAAKDLPGAVQAFQQAVELQPDHAGAWNNMNIAYKEMNDTGGSVRVLQQLVNMNPADADVWNNLSCALVEHAKSLRDVHLKDPLIAEACVDAREAIRLAPRVGIFHTSLGEALEASGDVGGAIEAYQKALEIDPSEKYAIEYLKRLGKPPV